MYIRSMICPILIKDRISIAIPALPQLAISGRPRPLPTAKVAWWRITFALIRHLTRMRNHIRRDGLTRRAQTIP